MFNSIIHNIQATLWNTSQSLDFIYNNMTWGHYFQDSCRSTWHFQWKITWFMIQKGCSHCFLGCGCHWWRFNLNLDIFQISKQSRFLRCCYCSRCNHLYRQGSSLSISRFFFLLNDGKSKIIFSIFFFIFFILSRGFVVLAITCSVCVFYWSSDGLASASLNIYFSSCLRRITYYVSLNA